MSRKPEVYTNDLSKVTNRQMVARAKTLFRIYKHKDRRMVQVSWRKLWKEEKHKLMTEASFSYSWFCE